MITTKQGECTATCNECGSEEHGGTLDFREFVAWLKDQGWQIKKIDDEWQHFCPDCGVPS